ncbi:hypothetical protein [Mycobacterium sp.]|uniref:hypothetical protein n=1 Tax=Mycobacterium sp. TaxID=1785 RepID=UPI0031E2D92D
MNAEPAKLWGKQYPFERNHLQRTITLIGLGGVLGVTVILLVNDGVVALLGISLIGAGLIFALAAVSRYRYDRETRVGFVILDTRGGSFVFGSAVAVVAVGLLVALLVVVG